MKYAYPQHSSDSLDAVRRHDESSDSATSQANLERQQDIAVVGETVPLVFCHRFDWGGELGVNGGVWISPRLIQLGIREFDLNMMYLLSQGNIENLKIDNTYWGYNKLTNVDDTAQLCSAYEAVPPCLDLDYDPGGSLSWTEVAQRSGPSVSLNEINYTSSTDKTVKMAFNFTSNCVVTFNGEIACGNDWISQTTMTCISKKGTCSSSGYYSCSDASSGNNSELNGYRSKGLQVRQYKSSRTRTICSDDSGTETSYYWEGTTQGMNRNATLYWTSGVQYYYEVRDANTLELAKEGEIWIDHGTSSLTIDGLEPSKYIVRFTAIDYGWASSSRHCIVNVNSNMASNIAKKNGDNQGFSRSAKGNGTINGSSIVTETIFNQLDFPDLPGGDQQVVGGLQDLTMLGIKGNIQKLRPSDGSGPDYFMQSHFFVEDGIEVERLSLGGNGPSPFYPDLVNHLMKSAKVLKSDQIDRDSLVLACKVNAAYKMYFNGVLQTTNSLSEWMTRTAPYFLLTPRQVDGKYGLWPVCPVNAANELSRDQTVPVMTITRDDIIADSYERQYITPKDRRPICLVMVYRDQPAQSVGQTVTVEVRYPGTALDGPFESHDLTEFCCRSEQAVYAARYILAKRRYTTHSVNFSMTRKGAQLKPGDIIKVDLSLETTDGAGITDAIFYQIESLSEGQAGTVAIEAMHFPVMAGDVSVVAYETHEGKVSIV